MKCAKCGTELKSILPFPRGFTYPHVCKAFRNVSADIVNGALGVGPEWAQPAYGEYYAKSVPVYAAVKVRADNVVRPPLVVYRTLSNGDREQVDDAHPLAVLLKRVNGFWTRGDLWRATSTYLDLWGSCYWLLKKTGPGSPPTEIWPLRPDRMRIITDKAAYIKGFEYEYNHTRQFFRTDEILWFRYFNPLDEFAGMSPIAPGRLSIEMGLEGMRHNKKIFENGMLWGSVALSADGGQITQEQVEIIEKTLEKKYAGTKNSHRPLITGNLKATNLQLSNKEMEFLGTLNWTIDDVVRVFGVPVTMLGQMRDMTFANADASERIFWRNTMMSLLMFLQEEINEMLAPMFGEDISCEFDLSTIEALSEDKEAQSLRFEREVKAGIRTINEVREELGLEPVPWGDEPPQQAPALGGGFGLEGFGSGAPTDEELQPEKTYRMYRRDWSEHALDTISAFHVRVLSRNEKQFLIAQKQLFDEQKDAITRQLGKERSAAGLRTKALGDYFFNMDEWIKRFKEKGAPFIRASLTESAEKQVSVFRLPVNFNPASPAIQRWLNDRVEFWAMRVNEETAKLLKEELEDGIAGGEGINDLTKRVNKVFNFSQQFRAEMIARTEVQAATNSGALEAYKQSGVVESKMWLATLDGRTRAHHIEAHRQIVPLEAKFEVGGEMVSHPGDGSAFNVIQCRCTLVPVLSAKSIKQSYQTGEKNIGPERTPSKNGHTRD